MLSEIHGANRQSYAAHAPQGGTAVPTPAPATFATAAIASPSGSPAPERATVKVQTPKPIEIKVDTEKMKAALTESLQKMNDAMRDGGRSLNFTMDEKVGGLVILVKNSDTGEVVRQIPSDVVVRIAHNIEAFKGILHNELS